MLEWFKAGFGISLGVIAAAATCLMVLGLWDSVAICIGKLRLVIRKKKA
jgi:hypothetical protein